MIMVRKCLELYVVPNFKKCFIYKKLIDGRVRSMGTKNILDHFKHCMAHEALNLYEFRKKRAVISIM